MTSPVSHNGITRREAVARIGTLLGGVAFVGGSGLLTACQNDRARGISAGTSTNAAIGEFSPQDIALLDETADTMLPTTPGSPGAKAARTGAFMALMVTDVYDPDERVLFREGLEQLDARSRAAHAGAAFLDATPEQRLALVEALDREQHEYTRRRDAAIAARARGEPEPPRTARGARTGTASASDTADRFLSDQRQENAPTSDVGAGAAPAITADAPVHWFRMMKELALLGFFTSEIGYTQAMRYIETPGRYDPCVPYAPGEKAWAPHA